MALLSNTSMSSPNWSQGMGIDDVLSRHGGCEPMRVIEGILGTADGF